MSVLSEFHAPGVLNDRLHDAATMTAERIVQVINETCRRLPMGRTEKATRIERLIEAGAWTDAALALIDLELPQWQVRRIAFDGGEWHCTLSRQRLLPDWLDEPIEAHHADLVLAVLGALIEAQHLTATAPRPSVPRVDAGGLFEPVSCDNFA